VRNQQCKDCQQDFATGSWHAVVQVRQRVTHKRTFYYLEQLLLKHNAHSDCLNIVTFRDGMDFYFTEKQKAVRFIDFLESHVPTKVTHTHASPRSNYISTAVCMHVCTIMS
jgi:nonsense-mediated mRNA decay protein 3